MQLSLNHAVRRRRLGRGTLSACGLGEVLDVVPSHELAQSYRSQAARLSAETEALPSGTESSDDGGVPLGLILGLALDAIF
jgi:hypothetical protein